MPRTKKEIKKLVEHTVMLWEAISSEDHSKNPKARYSRRKRLRLRARALVAWCLDQPVAT